MADRDTSIPGNQILDDSITQAELDLTNTPTDGQLIKINMPAGDMTAIDLPDPTDLNISGQTAEDFLIYDGTNWVAKGGTEKIKTGNTTRDLSIATGTQAITGIGFKPSYVIIWAVVNTSSQASWGFSDGTSNQTLTDRHLSTADSYSSFSNMIYLRPSGGAWNTGDISSFDADGFTISWTKTGSPTGTAQLRYTAFR